MESSATGKQGSDAAGFPHSPAHWVPPHIRGLLYREWLAHRNLIVGFWAVWLVCMPILMLFNHPAWVLAFGLLYASSAALAIGGMDAAEGSEEFVFSLPPTRSEVFLTRLALGGGNLLGLLAASLLGLWLNLPQALWGLVVQSGFTEPFTHMNGDWDIWTWLAVAIPVGVFAATFVTAALARSRARVGLSWLAGVLMTGVLWGLVSLAHSAISRIGFKQPLPNGCYTLFHIWIPSVAVLVGAVATLWIGHRLFVRKEGISRPTPLGGAGRWWLWLTLAILGVLVFVVFFGVSRR